MSHRNLGGPLRLTLFAEPPGGGRRRRPTDVMLLVLCVAVIAWTWVRAAPASSIDTTLSKGLSDLPDAVDSIWHVLYGLATLWALVVLAASVIRRQWGLVLDIVLAVALSVAVASVAFRDVTDDWPDLLSQLTSTGGPVVFPAMRIALVMAVLSTASPHLVLPARRVGRALVVVGALAAVGLDVTRIGGAAAAVALGVAGACTVHLLRGSPGGQLTDRQLIEAAADVGVEVRSVEPVTASSLGVQDVSAVGADGEDLLIRAYGRDAWDSQVVVRLWRSLAYRNADPRLPRGDLGVVEHQAYAALRAADAGVPVPAVVAAGATPTGTALLITAAARPLASCGDDLDDARFLSSLWSALAELHSAKLSHGSLDSRSVAVGSDGGAVLTDFAESTAAPTRHQLLLDRAQALVLGALVVSPESSLQAALEHLGGDGLAEVVPYLQPQALTPHLRRELKKSGVQVSELRASAAESAGVDDSELVKLRRATLGGIAQTALIAVAVWVIISAVANIGLDTLVEEFSQADWAWLIAALLFAQVAPVGLAFATLGATLHQLKLLPVIALQYAVTFIGLVVPSTAARVALKVRFFQRVGLSVPEALSISALDSVAGFVVQVVVLVGIPLAGFATLGFSSQIDLSGDGPVILALIGVIVVLLAITFAVPKLREKVVPPLKEMSSSLYVLRSWKKLGQIFGGNIWYQLVQAAVLGMCLAAFGGSATLSQLVLINTAVSLVAGFMPVPGGMGVSEAAIVAGLAAIGIDNATAVSTAIAFRLVTFYLPPIWGYPNLVWLRNNDFL